MTVKIIDYLRHLKENKFYGVLIYLAIPLIIGLIGFADTPDIYIDERKSYLKFTFCCYLFLILFMYVFGSSVCRKILGGNRVNRIEHKQAIEVPIRKYIADLKSAGINLSDKIEIFVSEMEYPFAYAIGQKTLVVSTGLLAYPELMEAKVKNELFKMYNLGSSTILMLLGNNIVVLVTSLFLLLSGFIDSLTGSRRKRFLGGTDSGDGAILFVCVLLFLSIWTLFSNLMLKSFVRKKTLEADEFVSRLGLGNNLCTYLDLTKRFDRPHRIKLFEFAKPSVDDRIASLQNMGVNYTM